MELPGIQPRRPGLCSHCSATELQQLDSHQLSQSPICTAKVVQKCLSYTLGSHSVCAIRTLAKVVQSYLTGLCSFPTTLQALGRIWAERGQNIYVKIVGLVPKPIPIIWNRSADKNRYKYHSLGISDHNIYRG